jgi:hypothetical protein
MANIIYALCDPRTDAVHYVGLSSVGLSRARQHLQPAARAADSAKGEWLRSMFDAGMAPSIRVLEAVESIDALSQKERTWIAKGIELGWPLTNASKGGEFGGRPSTGLTESAQLVQGPRWLLDAAREAARREGLTAAEWWRRAARMAIAASFPELLEVTRPAR